MSKKEKVENEQIKLKGKITGTSNKQSEKYKQSEPRKTLYFVPASKEDIKMGEDFGLTLYTSEEDGVDFFVIKLSESVNVYVGNKYVKMNTDAESNNFNVESCNIAIIKGENVGNTYYRVFAIQLLDGCKIESVKQQDPFGEEGEMSELDSSLDIGIDVNASTGSKGVDSTLDIASEDLPF